MNLSLQYNTLGNYQVCVCVCQVAHALDIELKLLLIS
jgi:hypothetical protein